MQQAVVAGDVRTPIHPARGTIEPATPEDVLPVCAHPEAA